MTYDKNIGKRLKELRTIHGFTQQQVADYLGIDQSNYSKIEHGKRQLRKMSKLKALCLLYRCSHEYILLKTDEYEKAEEWRGLSSDIDLNVIAQINLIMNYLKTLRTIQKNMERRRTD